jgi:ATP-dependent RNA helicase DDX10/DBP4
LLPTEEQGMTEALKTRGIVIPSIKIRGSKTVSVRDQLQRLAFQDPDLKYLAQRALVSYVRSVHLHHDKSIFKVDELPIEAFAASLGLAGAPKIRFLSRAQAKERKNAPHALAGPHSEDDARVHSSGNGDSAEDSDERSTDEEDADASQDELPPIEQEKAAKVCYISLTGRVM